MAGSLEVQTRAKRPAGREVRSPALRSHTVRLHQPCDSGGPAARRGSRAARPRIGVRIISAGLQKISRPHPAVLLRSRVEAVRQRMIRTLTGILACLILAGCGVPGEAYQPRPPPAAQAVIYLYRPYKLLTCPAN